MDDNIDNLWSVLFSTGYLTQRGRDEDGRYELAMANGLTLTQKAGKDYALWNCILYERVQGTEGLGGFKPLSDYIVIRQGFESLY